MGFSNWLCVRTWSMDHIERAYCSLGKFVVVFQWVENKYREIGWFILDPDRKQWPPLSLRTESNARLINKVSDLFVRLTQQYDLPNGAERAADVETLRQEFHSLRKFRNRLLHSTYIEIEVGGNLLGYLRSNPQVELNPANGEMAYDQAPFSEEIVEEKLQEFANAMFRLSQTYIHLIHWHPFERFAKLDSKDGSASRNCPGT